MGAYLRGELNCKNYFSTWGLIREKDLIGGGGRGLFFGTLYKRA